MVTAHKRLELQTQLDSLKDAKTRNQLGQFATPPALAQSIMQEALKLLGGKEQISFLEPSIGTGAFYEALNELAGTKVESAMGVEIDPVFADACSRLWQGTQLQVLNADFTDLQPEARFNLLVANPPYVRHHHIDAAQKGRLNSLASRRLGRRVSGLAGLYIYFILLADSWLQEDSVSAWLIPSEFMDVNYGEALRTYLTERVSVKRIHRYCPSDVQFSDALVTSTVLFFSKSRPRNEDQVLFTFGPDLQEPTTSASIPISQLRGEDKWSRFPQSVESSDKVLRLGDFIKIKRGLATGDNSFFIVSEQKARELDLPTEFLRPILPSPRNVKQTVVEADDNGYPLLPERRFLIDCTLSESKIEQRFPKFFAYLMLGKEKGIHKRYLSASRKPWYSQEQRAPAPLLCTYMGRQGKDGVAFRVVENKSRAVATNVWLMLYPIPGLDRIRDYAHVLAEAIREVGPEVFAAEGRVYGGGLQKMEPRELANIPVELPQEMLSAFSEQLQFRF